MEKYLSEGWLSVLLYLISILALSQTGMAASLIVDAAIPPWTRETVYWADTNHTISLWVSVHDLDGTPIIDLNATNFAVSALMVPKGFYDKIVSIASVDKAYIGLDSAFPNIYEINIAPQGSATWEEEGYIFLVEVVHGEDRGQKMLSLWMSNLPKMDRTRPVGGDPPALKKAKEQGYTG